MTNRYAPNHNLVRNLRNAGLASIAALTLYACTHDEQTAEEIAASQQATVEKQWDILENRGLVGRHELSFMQASVETQTETHSEASVEGDLDAFYFLIVGGAEGDLSGTAQSETTTQTVRSIRLAWDSATEQPFTTISEFPINILKIVEEEGRETPQVEFGKNVDNLMYLGDRQNTACFYDPSGDTGRQPGYHPDLCMTTTDYATPNEFLARPGFLSSVTLYMNPQSAAELYAQINS